MTREAGFHDSWQFPHLPEDWPESLFSAIIVARDQLHDKPH